MKKSNITIILMAFLLSASPIFAQDQSQKRAAKKEKIKAMKIEFIKTELSLTESEAQAFWPVYNKHEGNVKKLRMEHREVRKKLKGKSIDEMSDAEALEVVDGEMLFRERKMDLDKNFHADLKRVLPIKKVLKFHKAQHQFKRKLLKRMHGKRGGGKHHGGPRGMEEEAPDLED